MRPLELAIEIFGSQSALAHAIQTKQQNIWNWLNREGARIPAEYCPAIERATDGKVRCEDLRPDVAWEVLRMQTGDGSVQRDA